MRKRLAPKIPPTGPGPVTPLAYADHHRQVDWGSAYAQPTRDGFRVLAWVRAGGGRVRLTDAALVELPGLTAVKNAAARVALNVAGRPDLPTEFMLDGTVLCPGLTAAEVEAEARKRKSRFRAKFRYHLADAALGATDFTTRAAFVRDFAACSGPPLFALEAVVVRTVGDLMFCQQEFLRRGCGTVLRYGNAAYQSSRASPHVLTVTTFAEERAFEVVDVRPRRKGPPHLICRGRGDAFFEVPPPPGVRPSLAHVGWLAAVRFDRMTAAGTPNLFAAVGLTAPPPKKVRKK